MSPQRRRQWLIGAVAVVFVLATTGAYAGTTLRDKGPGPGFASGNGRTEATEVDVATKLAERVETLLVDEGDFMRAGQPLVTMQVQVQVQVLYGRRDEAAARRQQAFTAVAAAQAQVALRASDKVATQALVSERLSGLDAAERRLARSTTLSAEGASSQPELDDDRARLNSAQAGVAVARAQVVAAQAAVDAPRAQVHGAQSGVGAADATLASVQADITDSRLTAPRDGRVQYRVAQPGEVLPGGGKVLNLVDLGDVTMTFFMPEAVARRLALGSEVHVVLDVAPQNVIPARVSFVASTAQSTPKTMETASERQKPMFRVKAQLDRDLLQKHFKQVKTGLPGVAWMKLDAQAAWPAELAVKLPP